MGLWNALWCGVLAAILAVHATPVVGTPVGRTLQLQVAEAEALGLSVVLSHSSWVEHGDENAPVEEVPAVWVVVSHSGQDVAGCGGNSTFACASIAFALNNATSNCTNSSLPVIVSVVASDARYPTTHFTVPPRCSVTLLAVANTTHDGTPPLCNASAPVATCAGPRVSLACPSATAITAEHLSGFRVDAAGLLAMRGVRVESQCAATRVTYNAIHATKSAWVDISDAEIGTTGASVGVAGRGIRMGYGRLRVQRVRFVRNLMASVTGSCNGETCTGGTGGAIMLPDTASATVHACTFDANSAADGAAIAASCGQGKPCSLRVSLSFFKDNRAASSGGAVWVQGDKAVATVDASVFDGNAGHWEQGYAGGVGGFDVVSLTITRSVFGSMDLDDAQLAAVLCNKGKAAPTTVVMSTHAIGGAATTPTANVSVVVEPSRVDDTCVAQLPAMDRVVISSQCTGTPPGAPVLACTTDGIVQKVEDAPGYLVGGANSNNPSDELIECLYVIEVPENSLVELVFCDFNLGYAIGGVCYNQHLVVVDNDNIIGDYCGDSNPDRLISSTNRLTVQVHNSVGAVSGFRLRYRAIPFNSANRGGAIMADGTLFLSGSLIMGAEAEVGGAIFMWDGDGTVSGTTFVDNRAVLRISNWADGAAVAHWSSGTFTSTGCTFANNFGRYSSGAVFTYGTSRAEIRHSTLIGNTATWGGSVALNWGSGGLLLEDCTLSYNGKTTLAYGTTLASMKPPSTQLEPNLVGYMIASSSSVVMRRCTVDHSIGGVLLSYASTAVLDNVTISDSGAVGSTGQPALMLTQTAEATFTNVSVVDSYSATGSGITMWRTASLVGTDVTVARGHASYGGGILVAGDATATFTRLSVHDCTASEAGGGVLVRDRGSLTVTGGSFTGSTAADGAGMKVACGGECDSPHPRVSLTTVRVADNSAQEDGGGMHIDASAAVNLTNVDIDNNFARIDGGGMHVGDTASVTISGGVIQRNSVRVTGGGIEARGTSRIAATDVVLTGNNGGDFGGALHANDYSVSTWHRCVFTSNHAARSGGAIDVYWRSHVVVVSGTCRDNIASNGQGGFAAATVTTFAGALLDVYNSSVSHNTARSGGAFGLFSSVYVEEALPPDAECDTPVGAPADASFGINVVNSTVYANAAIDGAGGAFLASGRGCSLVIRACRVSDHVVTASGGAVLAQRGAQVHMYLVQCLHNSADTGACARMESGAMLVALDSAVVNNTAQVGGGIALSGAWGHLWNVEAHYNAADVQGGAGVCLHSARLTVCGGSLHDNTAILSGGALGAQKAHVTVTGTTVRNNAASFGGAAYLALGASMDWTASALEGNTASADGGVVFSFHGSSTFNDTVLSSNTAAARGGVATILQGGRVTFNRARFTSCQAANGGLVFAESDAVAVIRDSNATRGSAFLCGALSLGRGAMADLDNVEFSNHTTAGDGGIVCMNDGSAATLHRVRAIGNSCGGRGGVIVLSVRGTETVAAAAVLNATECEFSGNRAGRDGGAVFADGGTVAPSAAEFRRSAVLTRCVLHGNHAGSPSASALFGSGYGGAVAVASHAQATLDSCSVTGNTAELGGGGVFASGASRSRLTIRGGLVEGNEASAGGGVHLAQATTATIGGDVVFDTNVALRGGAIFLAGPSQLTACTPDVDAVSPSIHLGTVKVGAGNRGTLGGAFAYWEGPCRPSPSTWLAGVTMPTGSGVSLLGSTAAAVTAPSSLDGAPGIPLHAVDVVVHDGFGNPLGNQSFVVRAAVEAGTLAQARLVGQLVAVSSGGVARFDTLTIAAKPGAEAIVELAVTLGGIENQPDVSLPAQPQLAHYTTVHMAGCRRGYILSPTAQCVACRPDEYSWDSSDSACLPCPLDALCNGGDDFHPNPGFWRKDNTTALLYRCIIPRACTPEGCAEGYEGPLCDACSSGFGKNGDVCTRCPSTASNIAILTCVAFVLAAITVFVVQRARHRALTREVDKISIAAKIIVSYVQFVSMANGLDIQWSSELRTLFTVQQFAGSGGDSIASTSCLLRQLAAVYDMEPIYLKTTLFVVLPVFTILVVALFWMCTYAYRVRFRKNERRSRRELRGIMRDNVIITSMVILFMMYPASSTQIFELFSCKRLYGTSYLQGALHISCTSDTHLLWMVFVGLPGLLVLVVGIPLGAFFVLYSKRHQLDDPAVSTKYAFLLDGYKRSTPYWESIVLFRKVALVMAIVLFRDMGQIWQLVMAAMVTVLALCLHLHFKPHAFPRLQALEIMALSVSLLTFVLALLLLASGNGGSENATAELVVTFVIFLANALFVVVFILAMRSEAIKRAKQLAQKAKRNVKNAIHGRSTPKRTQLTDSPGSSGRPANGSANPSTTLQDNPLRVDRVEEWCGTPNSARPPVPSSPRDSSRPNAVELTRYHSPPPSRSRSKRQIAKRRPPSQ